MKKRARFPVGLRTAKTAVAIVIAMLIVDSYGATASRLIFAMLGAMTAMQPTFRESVESSLTQIVGVLIGAAMSIVLLALPVSHVAASGIGVVLVITAYNLAHITFSPALPCFIVVMICTSADIEPIAYAFGRIWDSAIGLGVGMLINTIIFPYDNSRQIRASVEGLDKTVLSFLEDMFDGDDILPDAQKMAMQLAVLDRQMKIFSNQKLLLRLRRQREQIAVFQLCERKAQELVAHMEVLSHMQKLGCLDEQTRASLQQSGATIADMRMNGEQTPADVVTNYHVQQILQLRRQLLEALSSLYSKKRSTHRD